MSVNEQNWTIFVSKTAIKTEIITKFMGFSKWKEKKLTQNSNFIIELIVEFIRNSISLSAELQQ